MSLWEFQKQPLTGFATKNFGTFSGKQLLWSLFLKITPGRPTLEVFQDSYSFRRVLSSRSRRSSHQRCSVKKSVLRNSTKFTAKHVLQNTSRRAEKLMKKIDKKRENLKSFSLLIKVWAEALLWTFSEILMDLSFKPLYTEGRLNLHKMLKRHQCMFSLR